MGKEKLHFSLLELAKCQKGPLRESVSTNFVTNVANSQVHQKIPFVNLKTQLYSKGQTFICQLHFRSIMRLLKQNPEGESLKRGKDALKWQNTLYNINLHLLS